jgi:hypothetical protein
MVCYKCIIVNTLHKGDNKDDDDDDDKNNNNLGSPVDSSVHTATRIVVRSTRGPGAHADPTQWILGVQRPEPTADHQPRVRRKSGAVRLLT